MSDQHEQQRPLTTTDAGIPGSSDEYSVTVGPDGPTLLQDSYLIEKMAQFNRERVPERVVHAKGSGAYGYFEVTEDVLLRYRFLGLLARWLIPHPPYLPFNRPCSLDVRTRCLPSPT